MKKYLLVVACALLLVVTGCSKKNQLICSMTGTNEDGQKQTMDVILDLDKDNKAIKASMVYDFGDKTLVDSMCDIYKQTEGADNVECSGTKITIKDMNKSSITDEEDDSESMIGKTKDEIIALAKEDGFTCK